MANGTHVRRTCIPPLQFSEERQMCMEPGTVDCPDIPDFWLYGAAAAAAANAATPSVVPPGALPPNSHDVPSHGAAAGHHGRSSSHHPNTPGGGPGTNSHNPFASSPLSVNSAPLIPSGSHNQGYLTPGFSFGSAQSSHGSHPPATSTWSNPFSGSGYLDGNGVRINYGPSTGTDQGHHGGGGGSSNNNRASPADHGIHNSIVQPTGAAPPHPPLLRPLTAVPYSSPLKAAYPPSYAAHLASGPGNENQMTPYVWYRLDPETTPPQPPSNSVLPLLPPRRYPGQNSLLDTARYLNTPSHALSLSSSNFAAVPASSPPQGVNSVLSLLNAQLGFDPLYQSGTSHPSQPPSNGHVQGIFPYETSLTMLNDAAPAAEPAAEPSASSSSAAAAGPPMTVGMTLQLAQNTKPEGSGCRSGERGFFADVANLCRGSTALEGVSSLKGYYFCSPFGDRAEFTCPTGRYFSEKTISCETLDKSTCVDLAHDQQHQQQQMPSKSTFHDTPIQATANQPPPSLPANSLSHGRPNNHYPGIDPALLQHLRTAAGIGKTREIAVQSSNRPSSPSGTSAVPRPIQYNPSLPDLMNDQHPLPAHPQYSYIDAIGNVQGHQHGGIEINMAAEPTGATYWNQYQPPPTAMAQQQTTVEASHIQLPPILPTSAQHVIHPAPVQQQILSNSAVDLGSEQGTQSVLEYPVAVAEFPPDPQPTSTHHIPPPVQPTAAVYSDPNMKNTLESKLRNWNMANFTENSAAASANAAVAAAAVETAVTFPPEELIGVEIKEQHKLLGSSAVNHPTDAKERMEKEHIQNNAYSMAVAFLKAREVLSTTMPSLRPLRYVDSRRTINLKLLAELLKG